MSENITKLTLDTLLERINAIGEEMRDGFRKMDARFEQVEQRLERIEQRLDATEIRLERVETLSDRVASAAYDARADIREIRIA